MTEKPEIQKEPIWLMTHNERLSMYQEHPKAIAEKMALVFRHQTVETIQNLNLALVEISEICPNRDRLLDILAKAVLKSVKGD